MTDNALITFNYDGLDSETRIVVQQRKNERKRTQRIRQQAMTDFCNPCCQACGFSYPPIVQLHHKTPLHEVDVVDTDTVWLCPNCHAMVHEIRKLYFKELPRNTAYLRARIRHMDYWLNDIAPKELAQKLMELAKAGTCNP